MTRKIDWKETLWKADCFLALHEKIGWLLFCVTAALTALRLRDITAESTRYTVIALLVLLLILTRRIMEQAPYRAVLGWMARRKRSENGRQQTYAFIERLDKKLPLLKRKEMDFFLTNYRSFLLFEMGKQEEAIALLKNYTAIWNDQQRKMLQDNIEGMERIMQSQAGKQEE